MRKILILSDLYRPLPGGMESFLTGIARNWEKDSVYVCIVSRKNQNSASVQNNLEFDLNENYSITRLDSSSGGFSFFSRKKILRDSFARILDTFSPDHILISTASLNIADLIHSVKRNISYSVILNGNDVPKVKGIRGLLYRKFLKEATGFYTLSNYLKLQIKSSLAYIPFSKIHVLPPAIDYRKEKKMPGSKPQDIRALLKNKKIFLSLGPLLSWKGIDSVIKALDLLDKNIRDKIHFFIVGSGPEFIFLQELVRLKKLEATVTMTGFLPDAQIALLMDLSHVFIQPNRNTYEGGQGLSVSLLEALSTGLPAIVGRSGGMQEVVEDGVNGFVVESGDIEQLAVKMSELTVSDSLRNKMSRNAKNKARIEFNIRKLCQFIDATIGDRVDGNVD